jgi:hypothetical protein
MMFKNTKNKIGCLLLRLKSTEIYLMNYYSLEGYFLEGQGSKNTFEVEKS